MNSVRSMMLETRAGALILLPDYLKKRSSAEYVSNTGDVFAAWAGEPERQP